MPRIAIDFGGTKTAAALVDGAALLDRRQIATPRASSDRELVAVLAELVAGWPALPIALACTGWIEDGRLKPVNPSNISTGLSRDLPIRDGLAGRTGLPVVMMNDAQAAAWGEFRFGAGRGARSMMFLTVSTGVGGGMVLDGRLQTGPQGFAGHVGHTVIDPRGPLCGCGRRGCLEAIASGRAIEAAAGLAFGVPVSSRAVFEAAAENAMALDLVTASAQAVATTLGNARAMLDLDCAVIGGSVGLAGGYLQRIESSLAAMPVLFRVPVQPATLGADAALLGVADWAGTLEAAACVPPSQQPSGEIR